MAITNLVKTVAVKKPDGTMDQDRSFGVSFNNVIDERSSKGNYTLAQFFDSYDSFLKTSFFVYRGVDKPENTKIALWIDTNSNNKEDLGLNSLD